MNLTIGGLINLVVLVVIVLLAFLMQVMPFLLVLTLINISFGVSSEVALVLIPAVLFAIFISVCFYVSVRTRKRLPGPLPVYRTDERPDPWKGLVTCLLPHSLKYRIY